MRTFLCIFSLIILTHSTKLFSQDTISQTSNYKHVVQLSSLDLMLKRAVVYYSYFVSPKHSLEATLGYRFASKQDYKILFIPFEDAFWLYNKLTVRLGFGNYFSNGYYLTPMFTSDYSFFNRRYFETYVDYDGDSGDLDYVISRNKKAIGCLVKAGYAETFDRLRLDIYLGLGYQGVVKSEKINQKINYRDEVIPDDYPLKSHDFRNIVTIHWGLLIGFAFK